MQCPGGPHVILSIFETKVMTYMFYNTFIIQKLIKGVLTLPSRVISSSAYSIGGVMHGCPASTLVDLLLNHRIVEQVSGNEM